MNELATVPDLAARRELATVAQDQRREDARQNQEAISMGLGYGIDPDDNYFRRITNGAKHQTRDLTPISHDRMLEVAWYLWEQNAFARRLIVLMTDLIIGEGVSVDVKADDKRVQEQIDRFWRRNQLDKRLRDIYMSNSVNGELALPVGVNEYTGIPVLGFVDSVQIKRVVTSDTNLLDVEALLLKGRPGDDDTKLDVIREDPATGLLTGNCFFHRINALPNSLRGRSDLATLADWLDLYDQFMFAEIERINLQSAFTWDLEMDGASQADIDARLAKLKKFKPGTVFGHNEKEKLQAVSPDLHAQDRSEVARLLRVHIAGSMGFPVSYLGDVDSNRATIEGQNDILLKTPAARQREFAGFVDQMVRFAVEQSVGKNPALFRGAAPAYTIGMPEIAAKDIARVGTIMASVVTAMDTGIANETVSKKTAIKVMATLIGQLGVEVEAADIVAELDLEAADRDTMQDMLQAELAKRQLNPPVPGDPKADDDDGDQD